jgi:uncharacterized membrane protein
MTDVDALCAEYLKRLNTALRDRSIPQGPQIVEQITEHLNEARAELSVQSEGAVRSILERLGRPEDIAAAAAAGGGTGPRQRAPWFKSGKGVLVSALLVVLSALGLTIGLLESNGSTPVRTVGGSTSTTTTTTTFGNTAAAVTVPVVLGETLSQATVTIQSAGLTIQGVDGDPNGLVSAQEPAGGSRVPSGSEITLHTQPASAS